MRKYKISFHCLNFVSVLLDIKPYYSIDVGGELIIELIRKHNTFMDCIWFVHFTGYPTVECGYLFWLFETVLPGAYVILIVMLTSHSQRI